MLEKEIYTRIYQLIKPYTGRLSIAMVCMAAVAALSAGQAYMVKPLLDEIFFKKDSLMLNLLPLALVLLFLIKGIFFYIYSYMLERVGHSVIRDLRKETYKHIQAMPLSFFNKMPTGELISRIISDVVLLQGAVSSALVGALKDSLQIVGLLFVVFYQNWKLAMVSMVILPLTIIPIIHFGRKYRLLSTQNQQMMADASSRLHETIAGNRIVKAFCRENDEVHRFSEIIDQLFGVTVRNIQVRSLSHPIIELLGGIAIALIIWYGGYQVFNDTATPGTFFSFLTALIMIYEPIKRLSNVNTSVQQGIAAAVRVFTLLDEKQEITESPDAIAIPPLSRQIEFRKVSFSYGDNREVLRDIDLTVKKNEIIAIVGPSGGGKSTLANLLPRFYEVSSGEILIDGKDIRQATLHSLRDQIAMVTQQVILFNDTVGNNIAYGKPDASQEEIIAAANAAYALQFINDMPQKFDTVIGESGLRLSGGQRQRIAIARAILKDAPILILDEATSALDTESEREVQKAIENLMQHRTTFIIAHRLSTIKKAGRILVIQDGRIAEEGSHEQLLSEKGLYTTLHDL
ncbi:MAG: lipid A export permease/ATP-binding protein MsbA [Desulfobulbaceae bacterium]|nr:lipid A export permease/ATP-binding protein MsbA [Desulfobulbaceae bacterium]